MRFALPAGPAAALRAALTTTTRLSAWWHPAACVDGERATPGLDDEAMRVTATAEAVTWDGALLTARFDLAERALTLEGAEVLETDDRAELAGAWEVALATLGWALERDPAWRSLELPVALAYTDAWSRIDGVEGLAGPGGAGTSAERVPVRIAGARLLARRLLVAPPRALLLDLDGALLRVVFGPGESVNAARVDLLSEPGATLPAGWEAWLARRLGMTWVAQLGEEG